MRKLMEFHGCVIGVTADGLSCLIDGPDQLKSAMDGAYFDDHCLKHGAMTLPTKPGVYVAIVEYWFSQGYFEGYPAPGECDVDFRLTHVRRHEVHVNPRVEHCDVVGD